MKSIELQHELERKIDLYICGRLNQEQIDALWVEMIENPAAYTYLKTSVALRSIIKDNTSSTSEAPVNSITPKQSRNWKNYAAAAAIVVSTGVGGTYVISSLTDSTTATAIKPFDKLELVVYRSTSQPETLTDIRIELKSAIDTALLGNNSEALIALSRVLESTDDELVKAEAYLNIGILEYNSNDFSAAVVSLQNAADLSDEDGVLHERVLWNLAHAQMASGNQTAAKVSIQRVVALEGAHSRAAKSYLDFMK